MTPKLGNTHIFPHICKHAYTCTKKEKENQKCLWFQKSDFKKKMCQFDRLFFRCYWFFAPIRVHFPSLDYKTKHQLSRKRRLIFG